MSLWSEYAVAGSINTIETEPDFDHKSVSPKEIRILEQVEGT